MSEKLLDKMDENFETTKNESRDSEIGFLQSQAAVIYPSLVKNNLDSFFWSEDYFQGEKVNGVLLAAGKNEVEQLKQVGMVQSTVNTL